MEIKNLAADTDEFTGNVFLISNSENNLIDTGQGSVWQKIEKLEKLDKVIITHSHHDHTNNLDKIKEKFNAKVFAYNPENLKVEASKLGDKISICGQKFEVIHTPGHKDDSICLYSDGELFTGDLIFPKGKFGRTDLAEGDREKLIESIKKIKKLNVKEFYPGHGKPVLENADKWISKSLEEAKKRNPKYS